MPLTQAAGIAALQHIVVNVWGHDIDGHIMSALKGNGLTDIRDMLTLDDNEYNELDYRDPNAADDEEDPTFFDLNRGEKGILKAFRHMSNIEPWKIPLWTSYH